MLLKEAIENKLLGLAVEGNDGGALWVMGATSYNKQADKQGYK